MRFVACLLFFAVGSQLYSRIPPATEVDPWKAHCGLMAGMNTSTLRMSGGYGAGETSTMQWSATFGLFFKSNVKNMFRFEVQTGYETTGAGREYYYQRSSNEVVRIFDRYRTIPLTILLTRNLGWKEMLSVGAGFKSSIIINHSVRHATESYFTGWTIIYTPEVLRWYGSPAVQLSANFLYAEVALTGWYAITPMIDQFDVKAAPYGITLQIKARLFQI